MANKWGIPSELGNAIRKRDTECIYCRQPFGGADAPTASRASCEHIINDASIISYKNIALCCRGCNASKGQKSLEDWLHTTYCKRRNIKAETLAQIAKAALP